MLGSWLQQRLNIEWNCRDNMLQLLQNAGNGPSLPYMFLPGNHEVRAHAWRTLLGCLSAVQCTVCKHCTVVGFMPVMHDRRACPAPAPCHTGLCALQSGWQGAGTCTAQVVAA